MAMKDPEFVVDDCLGLVQFLTQTLTVEETTQYLLAIDGLTLTDWKAAKCKLPETHHLANRTSIDLTIKDIAVAFKNNSIETSYLVKNLALIPGFQPESLALYSYVRSTVWAVKRVSSSVLQQKDNVICRTHLQDDHFSTYQTTHI